MITATIDFDGTINDHFGGHLNPHKEKVQEMIKRLISEGFDVKIVTRRFGPERSKEGSKNEHIIVFDIADKLGIPHSNVHFVNRDWKYKKLIELGSNFHLDDDPSNIFNIKIYAKDTIGVQLKDFSSIEDFYNLCTK